MKIRLNNYNTALETNSTAKRNTAVNIIINTLRYNVQH